MATQTPRSVDRTIEKMLRKARKPSRGPAGAAGSPASAAEALAQMAEIQKFVSRGDIDTAQTVALKSVQAKAATSEPGSDLAASGTAAGRSAKAGSGPRGLMVGACVAVCLGVMVVAGLFSGMMFGGSHSVSGVVMLDKRPLAGVEVSFFPKGGQGKPMSVKTTERGKFSIDRIPAGEYRIFLTPGDAEAALPQHYRSAESTPFQIKLTSDRADLRMLASSERKKPSR